MGFNKKGSSISQILILILGIIAFAFMVGSSIGVVSAADETCPEKCEDNKYFHPGTVVNGKCQYSGSIDCSSWAGYDAARCSLSKNGCEKINGEPCAANSECISNYCSPDTRKCETKSGDSKQTYNSPSIEDTMTDEDVNKYLNDANIPKDSKLGQAIINYAKRTGSQLTSSKLTKFVSDWKSKGGTNIIAPGDETELPKDQIPKNPPTPKEEGTSKFKKWLTDNIGQYSRWGTILLSSLAAFSTAISIAAIVDANANERNSRGIWAIGIGVGAAATIGTTAIASAVAASAIASGAAAALTAAGGSAALTAAGSVGAAALTAAGASVSSTILAAGGTQAAAAAASTAVATGAMDPALALASSGAMGLGTIPIIGIGVVLAALAMGTYLLLFSKDHYREILEYVPQIWQPVTTGNKCLECNKLEYGCNEYQCKSYGPACEIINKGEIEERCVAIEDDKQNPVIKPLEEALKKGYVYEEYPAVVPGVQGVRIIYEDDAKGCLPYFESILLGVEVSEAAQCKIDKTNKQNFDDLAGFMQSSSYVEKHILFIPGSMIPSLEAISALGMEKLQEDRKYQFFIGCRDYNGNPSVYNLMMEFCVQDGPDTTAPTILGTNWMNGAYIQNNRTEVPLEVYTNEPAECKWDFQDKSYDSMENEMKGCSKDASDYIGESYNYGCKSILTGLKDGMENTYYIRCKDKPWWNETMEGRRVANSQSTPLKLYGTNTLAIQSLTVNEKESSAVISDSTTPVKVTFEAKTIGGAEEGAAICGFKGISDSYNLYKDFYNDGNFEYTYQNVHDDWFPAGDYNFIVRCVDKGGNSAYQTINFTIKVDKDAPIIARAYFKDNKMNLITNEEANCVYSTKDCTFPFDGGTKITSSNQLLHSLPWDTQTELFIKCEDKYGNQPISPEECSMVVRAYDNYEEEEIL